MAGEDGNAAAVAEPEVVLETPVIEEGGEKAGEKAVETPPDYAALLKEATERNAKLEHDLASTKGALKGKLDTEAVLSGIRREVSRTNQRLDAYLKGQETGDPAQVKKEIEEFQAKTQREDLASAFQDQANELWSDLLDEAEDAGLEMRDSRGRRTIAALESDKEWAEVRTLWDDGLKANDLRLMRQALREAKNVRREAQRKEFEGQEAGRKKAAGALSTPNLKASAKGPVPTSDNADALWLEGKLTDAQYRAYLPT